MAYVATIGASTKTLDIRAGSLRFTESLQSRGSISFKLVNDDVSYTPPKWAAVTIEQGSDVIAKGVITRPTYGGVAGAGTVAIEANTTCGDLKTHWEKRRVTLSLNAGTMKSRIQALSSIYTGLGFTLDAGQDDGPTVGPFDFVNVTLFDAFRAIADSADPLRVITVDLETLTFKFVEPGDVAAPWDIEDDDGNIDGDLTVEPNGNLQANNVLIEYGDKRLADQIDTFVGDGSTVEFPLTYLVNGPIPDGYPHSGYGLVYVNGIPKYIGPASPGQTWTYDASDPTAPFIKPTSGTAPGVGVTISFKYQTQYPKTVRAFDASSITAIGQIDHWLPAAKLFSRAEAQRIADQTLAVMLGGPRIVRYPTTRAGLHVGMTQHIQSTLRDIDADFLITEVSAQDQGGDCLVYSITSVEGGLPPKPWQDTKRESSSGSGGGSNTSPPSPGSTSGSSDIPGGSSINTGTASQPQVFVAHHILTHADLVALSTTPFVALPSPGPGLAIVPVKFQSSQNFAAAYNEDVDLVLRYGDGDGGAGADALTDALVGMGVNAFSLRNGVDLDLTVTSAIDKPLVITAGALTGGDAANLQHISILYYIVPVTEISSCIGGFIAALEAGSSDDQTLTSGTVDTTGADMIVLFVVKQFGQVKSADGSSTTDFDNKGNSYTQLADVTVAVGEGQFNLQVWVCQNPIVGSGHSWNISTRSGMTLLNGKPALAVSAWTGLGAASIVDFTSAELDETWSSVWDTTTTTTTVGPASGRTPAAPALILTALATMTSSTISGPGTGFTGIGALDWASTHWGIAHGYKAAASGDVSSSAAAWAHTSADDTLALLVVFQPYCEPG